MLHAARLNSPPQVWMALTANSPTEARARLAAQIREVCPEMSPDEAVVELEGFACIVTAASGAR